MKLHPLLTKPIPFVRNDNYLKSLDNLLAVIPEKPRLLLDLTNRHIVSAWQFDRDLVLQLVRLAAYYESTPVLFYKPLAGKILISAFYEPSTRTRLSFESAWHRLGGDIMSITDPASTGMAKGESLEDIAEMFNNYGDVVVLRDKNEDSVYRMLDNLLIPIVNAGNGIDEHPTQALSDIYAILRWAPWLANPEKNRKIKIGIIGTPGKMRTVRSFLVLLSLFHDSIEEVVIINPDRDIFDPGQKEDLEQKGLKITHESSLNKTLPELDVVYINSIAWIGDSFEKLAGDMKLHSGSPLKKDSIILHPLARGEELDYSLDKTGHNWYFNQARGAVFTRMALLTAITQRVNLVTDTEDPTVNS